VIRNYGIISIQVNIVDTRGVLSGEKQRTSRGYDFAKVAKWFAARSGMHGPRLFIPSCIKNKPDQISTFADMVLLMFDPSKLDISDELKSVIEELQPYEEKVCCVLNKADNLDIESLMRVTIHAPTADNFL
jgi:EH domain-containing protein 1